MDAQVFKVAFNKIDKDGKGSLSLEEFRQCISLLTKKSQMPVESTGCKDLRTLGGSSSIYSPPDNYTVASPDDKPSPMQAWAGGHGDGSEPVGQGESTNAPEDLEPCLLEDWEDMKADQKRKTITEKQRIHDMQEAVKLQDQGFNFQD